MNRRKGPLVKQRSLNFKIISIICLLIVGIATVGMLGLSKMAAMNDALTEIVETRVSRVIQAKGLEDIYQKLAINQRDMILHDDPVRVKAVSTTMTELSAELIKNSKALATISTETGKAELTQFEALFAKWSKLNDEVIVFAIADRNKEALAKVDEAKEFRAEAAKILKGMVERNDRLMHEAVDETERMYVTARTVTITIILLSILIGIGVAMLVLRSLSKAIGMVIENLRVGSQQVSEASTQIASSSEMLSEASTEQASSLEETVATIEEMTSMVTNNAANAKQASDLASATSNMAARGEQEIRSLVNSMGEISNQSKKMSEIINVIDDIAFQTNLLALNAAVEAARAGEQGKGFAVVADAVRSLAQRSSIAAKDISEMIGESVSKIEKGSQQAEVGGQVLVEILDSVKKVANINGEIAGASGEQANGITQISKAMNQLDQVTQVNAATSEEAAASAEELSAQAVMLTKVVGDLILAVHGGVRAENPAPSVNSIKKPTAKRPAPLRQAS